MSAVTRTRLKYVCHASGQYGLNVPAAEYVGDGVRLIRTTDLATGRLAPDETGIFVPEELVTPTDRLEPHDLLLSRSGTIGRAFLVPVDAAGMAFAGFLIRFRALPDVSPRFLYYCTQSADFQARVQAEAVSNTIQNFNADRYGNLEVPSPPLDQQRAIADFLDRETARIDTLIEEQQGLIQLLRERRQSVIDTTIASVKAPSAQLRRAITFLTSGSRGWGDYYAETGERFLRIGNLPRRSLDLRGDVQFVSLPVGVTEGERTRLHDGDLLFSITAFLGSVAVATGEWVGGYVSQHVALCRVDPSLVQPRFIGWVMLSSGGQDQLKLGAAGGTKVQLALDDIRSLVVPFAPMDVQVRIAEQLKRETSKIDRLIGETERFIELSKERRAALITAAITGQIDVREPAGATADGQ